MCYYTAVIYTTNKVLYHLYDAALKKKNKKT